MCDHDAAGTAGAEWRSHRCRQWGGPWSHDWRESGAWRRGWWCRGSWGRGTLAGYHWLRKELLPITLVLRTAHAAPVWRGGNSCFNGPYGSENRIEISAKLY